MRLQPVGCASPINSQAHRTWRAPQPCPHGPSVCGMHNPLILANMLAKTLLLSVIPGHTLPSLSGTVNVGCFFFVVQTDMGESLLTLKENIEHVLSFDKKIVYFVSKENTVNC